MHDNGWPLVRLSDIARLTTGKLDSNQAVVDGQYPFFTCSPETLQIDKYAFDDEAVLLAGNNANGIFSVKYFKGKFNAYQRTYVITARVPNAVDIKYLYYQISLLQSLLGQRSIGTATKFLTLKILEPLEFPLPPLPIQRRIAEILGRLDDKIEVNRRINRTLERMAQALYKHWFVDFGPFQEGEFVESEVGLAPKGWEVKRLRDVCNLTMGQSPESEFYNDEGDGLPFHQGVTDFGERFPRHRRHCVISPRIALPGDILLSVRAPVGRINLADTKLVIGRGLAAINHRRGYQSLAFYQMKHLFAEEDSMGSGTIFRAVSKGDLENLRLVVPPDELAREFDRRVSVWDAQIASNSVQTESLTATRDYLLPRLLAGEVEV